MAMSFVEFVRAEGYAVENYNLFSATVCTYLQNRYKAYVERIEG